MPFLYMLGKEGISVLQTSIFNFKKIFEIQRIIFSIQFICKVSDICCVLRGKIEKVPRDIRRA